MLRSSRRGVTIAEVMMAGAIGAAMLALLLPGISAAIANSQGSQCRNNLARLAQALNAYHDARGKYPPSQQMQNIGPGAEFVGNRRPNWLIITLPFMGEQALFDQFATVASFSAGITTFNAITHDIPFGAATATEIPALKCPADAGSAVPYQVNRNANLFNPTPYYQYYGRSNYGSNACLMPPFNYFSAQNPHGTGQNNPCGGPTMEAWDPTMPYSWMTRGVMGYNASVTRAQITDGTSKTILIGEMRAGLNAFDARGIWADGRAGGSSVWFHIFGGPNYCFDDLGAEAAVVINALGNGNTTLGHQIAQQSCMDALNSGSGRPQGTFRSQHPDGAFFAMADGSVKFISTAVSLGQQIIPGGYAYADWHTGNPNRLGTWERLLASGDGLVVDDSTDPNYSSTVSLFILGDMNGDGVMNNFDIEAMEVALVDPAAYLATYPTLTDYQLRGDINQDGVFNNFDIQAFEEMLMGSS